MSQYPHQPALAPVQQNTLGIVGFVISLVGLFVTGGIACPIGLIISLVAMGRAPRGFAIAGVVLGAIGSCGAFLMIFFFGVAILGLLGLAVAAIALAEPEKIELTNDMVRIAAAAAFYQEENGAPPADLSLLELRDSTRIDPWGNRYQYHFIEEDPGFDVVSAGGDGTFGTEDDVMLSTLGEAWEAADSLEIDVDESDDGGRVLLNVGPYSVEAIGDDDHGTVILRDGSRIVRIVGDDDGGHITVDREEEAGSAEATEEPDTAEAPEDEGP